MSDLKNWWEAPEWGKEKAMVFPDRRDGARMKRIDTDVEYDEKAKRWVATPIRIYVGPSVV